MTKPFLWFLPILVLATLAGPAAAQLYSAPPQPWQQAMPQGFGTSNFTNGPPGVVRYSQPPQYSAPPQPWQTNEVPSTVANAERDSAPPNPPDPPFQRFDEWQKNNGH
jgi:hypothetical protein